MSSKPDIKWICFEDEAYYCMIEDIVTRLDKQKNIPKEEKWINQDDALELLDISKSTLQRLRDNGKISFSKTSSKKIMYDKKSLLDYLDKNTRKTF
ncbi:helix-turn-helix domain-containing protein [Pedobacter sp. MC2016-24]|uniref:helix-turn-helix domain-containing protein n=1 Tax=Pedobacter sp. MC2016-24 TaxID=2780090 RepID=UPI00187F03F4|nr:helix-turn-helix domain-containing protein [Pedobacter sp. MC2016-24]MBE9602642.1 helix-turn-helix domain-containing protein [Pedobacter sp. MC2016-24]